MNGYDLTTGADHLIRAVADLSDEGMTEASWYLQGIYDELTGEPVPPKYELDEYAPDYLMGREHAVLWGQS